MSAKTMIENALSDKDVQTALAGYGYDEARLQLGPQNGRRRMSPLLKNQAGIQDYRYNKVNNLRPISQL